MKNSQKGPVVIISGAAILAGLLTGCTTYEAPPPPPPTVVVEQPAPPIYVAPPPAPAPAPVVVAVAPAPQPPVYVAPVVQPEVVVIHSTSDFYTPLQAYGRWVDVPGYGRCWTPANVDPNWRPYADGHWERTDAGWYWVSDERWGWATYHYGRWCPDDQYGWIWVPQTEWAPAWVAWRDGGGYTGWAPLPPAARFGRDRGVEFHDADIDRRAFVFVRQKDMMEQHRHQDVIVNNVTVINKTVNITKITVVNNVVINEGPRPEVVAQVTGHKVEARPVRELRVQQESHAVARLNRPSAEETHPMTPNGNPAHPELNHNNNNLETRPAVPNGNPVHPVVNNNNNASETHPVHNPTEPVRPANPPGQPPRPIATQPRLGTPAMTNRPGEIHRETARPGAQPGATAKTPNPDQNHPQARGPVNPPGWQPGQPAKSVGPEQNRPQNHGVGNPPAAAGHEVKPGAPALTPKQKLEQEKKLKALPKAHPSTSTNAPVAPPPAHQ